MASRYSKIVYTEVGMRPAMQIGNKDIPVDQTVALRDALSESGLEQIVIGSFVSPKYTPKPGAMHTAPALNEKGVERAMQYSPPVTIMHSKHPRLRDRMRWMASGRGHSRSSRSRNWPGLPGKDVRPVFTGHIVLSGRSKTLRPASCSKRSIA